VVVVVMLLPGAGSGLADEDGIRRLRPAAFPVLPGLVRVELERRGCTMPQDATNPEKHNVIRGQFARRGQFDWAVLCSVKGASSILVFWNGSAKAPASIAPSEDSRWVQSLGQGKSGYSRRIAAVGRAVILSHYHAYGGQKPPSPLDHQGIDDAFVGKASVTYYFHRGKWLQLTGAD